MVSCKSRLLLATAGFSIGLAGFIGGVWRGYPLACVGTRLGWVR